MGERILIQLRAVAVVLFVSSLLLLTFSLGQLTVAGNVVASDPIAVQSYTKAVCDTQENIKNCRDVQFIEYGGETFQVVNSKVTGQGVWLEN